MHDMRSLILEMEQWIEAHEQRLPRAIPRSLELEPPPAPAPPEPCSPELEDAPAEHYHVGHFSERYRLSPSEAWTAERLFHRANHLRPIRGRHAQARMARRIAGIVSAVRNGRVASTHWGHSMLAKRGGLAMAAHGSHILAENREAILTRRQALKAVMARRPQTEFDTWQQDLTAKPPQEQCKDFMAY